MGPVSLLGAYIARMRTDWVPFSAAALVVGAMSLVLGAVLNPVPDGRRVTGVFQAVEQADGRWLAMASCTSWRRFC